MKREITTTEMEGTIVLFTRTAIKLAAIIGKYQTTNKIVCNVPLSKLTP
jgi:hypothetical protein